MWRRAPRSHFLFRYRYLAFSKQGRPGQVGLGLEGRAGPPPHFHPWGEACYLISGEVEFQVDDETLRVSGGDFVYAPANTVHAFQGVSKMPAIGDRHQVTFLPPA